MSGGRLIAGVVIAALVGLGLAYGVHQLRTSSPTSLNPSPSPSQTGLASPSPSASPSAGASASPETSPTSEPTSAPTSQPTTAPTTAPTTSGGVTYPAQITAGSKYSYSGSGTLTEFATDNRDVVSASCAGINDTSETVPAGYQLYSFVAFHLSDKKIVSAGWVKDSAGRASFGSIQNADGSGRQGSTITPGTLASGSHTYCVSYSGGAWHMTMDGTEFFSAADSVGTSSGGSVQYQTSLANNGVAAQAQTLVIPGFHDITVGGHAPTRLVGGSASF